MGFLEHLEELRKRLVVCAIAVFTTAMVCYYYWQPLFRIVQRPLPKGIKLNYTTVMEPFIGRFRLAIFAGVFVAFPIILYQTLLFIAPALKSKEKRFLYPMMIMMIILFICGVIFGYYYLLPVSVKWLFGQGEGLLTPLITFDRYANFVGLFLLAMGGGFETPVVILFLTKIGVVSPKTLRKNWRIAYVAILTIAAIITPDWSPITMGVMAIPMFILYEMSIFLSRFI
jgi:sec-independent protein translocase protein TatC